MKLIILEDYDKTSEWAAKYIRNRILKFKPGPNKYFTLGLPTGKVLRSMRSKQELFKLGLVVAYLKVLTFWKSVVGGTPLGCYKKLIDFHKKGEISFEYVKTFNMDEYVALPRDHPESYHSFMWNNFFKHIDIKAENAHILDGNAPDLQKECQEFEDKIKAAGGIELFIGGENWLVIDMIYMLIPSRV